MSAQRLTTGKRVHGIAVLRYWEGRCHAFHHVGVPHHGVLRRSQRGHMGPRKALAAPNQVRGHVSGGITSHCLMVISPPVQRRVGSWPHTVYSWHSLAPKSHAFAGRTAHIHFKHIWGRVWHRRGMAWPGRSGRHAGSRHHHALLVAAARRHERLHGVRHVTHHGPLHMHAVRGWHGDSRAKRHRRHRDSSALRDTHHTMMLRCAYQLLVR
mmetsp:Transcript_16193/g.28801  ORF Transcript_16193/g.28801 Transcript_16193/m.28801 type:complete len:211 (-) Transcript_16193:1081-1713(-)